MGKRKVKAVSHGRREMENDERLTREYDEETER